MSYRAYHGTVLPTRTTRGCCTWIRRIRMIAAITCARWTPIRWLARSDICRLWVSNTHTHTHIFQSSIFLMSFYPFAHFPLLTVPPNILDIESTPSSVAVRENQNINMTCRADGFPTPKIIWRREDGEEIAVEKKKKGMLWWVRVFDTRCASKVVDPEANKTVKKIWSTEQTSVWK